MKTESFAGWLKRWPLIAILRGIKPAEALDIGEVLVEAGFCIVEVPLNSPEPFASIIRLSKRFGDNVLIGAGTVMDREQVQKVADAGGRIIVMPHADERIVEAAKRRNLYVVPGFATATEGFRMIQAGADAIKLFPAEANPPKVLKALRAVLPREMPVLPVGGITPGQHEGILGRRCRWFRARFGAVQTRRYGGKGRAVGGGFSRCASGASEKAEKPVNVAKRHDAKLT